MFEEGECLRVIVSDLGGFRCLKGDKFGCLRVTVRVTDFGCVRVSVRVTNLGV